jgi:hypothetical protein
MNKNRESKTRKVHTHGNANSNIFPSSTNASCDRGTYKTSSTSESTNGSRWRASKASSDGKVNLGVKQGREVETRKIHTHGNANTREIPGTVVTCRQQGSDKTIFAERSTGVTAEFTYSAVTQKGDGYIKFRESEARKTSNGNASSKDFPLSTNAGGDRRSGKTSKTSNNTSRSSRRVSSASGYVNSGVKDCGECKTRQGHTDANTRNSPKTIVASSQQVSSVTGNAERRSVASGHTATSSALGVAPKLLLPQEPPTALNRHFRPAANLAFSVPPASTPWLCNFRRTGHGPEQLPYNPRYATPPRNG